jgi:ArsR family transcriptional regulator
MEEFLKITGALYDETRIKLLLFIYKHKKVCVCEIEASFDMLQSRLSRHLKILKDAGFLKREREGKYIFYSLKKLDGIRKCLLDELLKKEIPVPKQITPCNITSKQN